MLFYQKQRRKSKEMMTQKRKGDLRKTLQERKEQYDACCDYFFMFFL